MRITHEIYKCQLTSSVDLQELSSKLDKCTYAKIPFHSIQWSRYEGNCQIFNSGKIVCHGTNLSLYLDHLRTLGYEVRGNTERLVVKSAAHKLAGKVDYYSLCVQIPDLEWHPELFHAPILKRNGISYIIYHTGNVVVTGLKTEEDLEEAASVLLDLELVCS